jgi:ADP-heptose:LPS heptosyltransferase
MDNREASAILARLDQGGQVAEANGATALACATLLLEACRADGFQAAAAPFRLLCRLATDSDRQLSALATNTLYHEVIEPLCDDFSADAGRQAHAVLAGLIGFITATPAGHAMREQLDRLSLNTPESLLARWHHLTSLAGCPDREDLQRIETVLIPSRISVGADVAITSVLAQRLTKALPGAEIVLVGPAHLAELFGHLPRVRHLPFALARRGDLADRLLFWPQLLAEVAPSLADLPDDRILVVDSDSRLTQLGLLPLAVGPATCQFPSQSLTPAPGHGSLTALANQWLDRWLGGAPLAYPAVSPHPDRLAATSLFCARLRAGGARRLLLVNFGVGGEPRKSLPDPFEQQMLTGLLAAENSIIILDMGCGSEEKVRAEKLLAYLAANGQETLLLQEWQLPAAMVPFRHGVVGLGSSLGTLAALGASVDGYLGYDSCGQHLANGVGAPAITIFAGAPNSRFLERWSPLSPTGSSLVIPVSGQEPNPAERAAIISRILQTVQQQPPPR